MSEKKKVKIRYREVITRMTHSYGRFGEYQVVEGRTILSRHDLEWQAIRWCEKRGYEIVRNP